MTFNPWWGCTKIRIGCEHCYAECQSARWGEENYWGRGAARRFFDAKHWNEPLRWNRKAEKDSRAALVFCGSMCDWLEIHENPDIREKQDSERMRLFELIEDTPWLIWLLLTKRLDNWYRCVPQEWLYEGMPGNVWLGVTICNNEELESDYGLLSGIERAFRPAMSFLSLEPLLGPLDLVEGLYQLVTVGYGPGPDDWGYDVEPRDHPIWLIAGGESRQRGKCRKTELQDILDVIAYGKEFGQPVFVKQLGHLLAEELGATGKGDNPEEWPEALRVQQFPFARLQYMCPHRGDGRSECVHPENGDQVCFLHACPIAREAEGVYVR